MSAEAMALALHHSQAKGTAKLVLIGIANHDGDGGAWPSVATLARYAGVDARNVQRALERLEKLGEIRRVIGGGGTNRTPDHSRPNLYELLIRCPHTCDGTKNHNTNARLRVIPHPVAETSPPGASAAPPLAETSPEQSQELTTRLKEKTHVSKRGREAVCVNGHPIEVTTESGSTYCAYACAGGAA